MQGVPYAVPIGIGGVAHPAEEGRGYGGCHLAGSLVNTCGEGGGDLAIDEAAAGVGAHLHPVGVLSIVELGDGDDIEVGPFDKVSDGECAAVAPEGGVVGDRQGEAGLALDGNPIGAGLVLPAARCLGRGDALLSSGEEDGFCIHHEVGVIVEHLIALNGYGSDDEVLTGVGVMLNETTADVGVL